MASARVLLTATTLGDGRVLIAGGMGAPQAAEIYDPISGTFAPAGTMLQQRYAHTATMLDSGAVLLAGGSASKQGEIWKPGGGSGTFVATNNSMSAQRRFATATKLLDGRVLIAGGSPPGKAPLASVELYDPATNTFSSTGSMTTARTGHAATLLPNGQVLITGGHGGPNILASTELYDPATGTFSATVPMGSARNMHTATLLPDGHVLVAGGYDDNGLSLNSADLYDPASGTLSATGPMVVTRYYHVAILLQDGRVLVMGGSTVGCGTGSVCDQKQTNAAELYDPLTGTFSATGSMTKKRNQFAGALLQNGDVLVAGGMLDSSLAFLAAADIGKVGP